MFLSQIQGTLKGYTLFLRVTWLHCTYVPNVPNVLTIELWLGFGLGLVSYNYA